tara:strand:+ start:140 stop:319 length:180 start_codon:yes stop_codon:yes gene_type:complete
MRHLFGESVASRVAQVAGVDVELPAPACVRCRAWRLTPTAASQARRLAEDGQPSHADLT